LDERVCVTDWFEQHRPHLRAVAYRMLGSVSETDMPFRKHGCGFAARIPGPLKTCRPG